MYNVVLNHYFLMLYFYVHAYFRDCMFGKTDERLHPSDTEMFNVKKKTISVCLVLIEKEGERSEKRKRKLKNT